MFPGDEPLNLQIIKEFPVEFETIDTVWIPLSDGKRVAARIWRPVNALQKPVSAILEYIPYRRRDGRLADDEQIHPFFSGHGFASVRVDIRGSGDSEGLLKDEYLKLEQDDALDIITWIADQPWCSGNVGMMGLSWGGFNSLQVATRRPAALKAIIAVGATVDRYNDDVHYKHGCMLNENFGWGTSFMSFCSRPPDPDIVGERWRNIWYERLNELQLLPANWIGHQLRDEYWQHGSVCEDYSAIECPVMIVTGWGDLYVNAIPRLLENLNVPCSAIAGSWAHQYPHLATPGPAMDFLGEATAWWRQWLDGEETGCKTSTSYRAFRGEGGAASVDGFASELPGQWVATDWDLENHHFNKAEWFLAESGLTTEKELAPPRSFRSAVDVGVAAGELIPHCLGPEMVVNQQADDGGSLTFDSPLLTEPIDLWGDAELMLTLRSDRPTGNLIVRLCDVAPDGTSKRVTLGMINLLNREGDTTAVPMPIDKPISVRVQLDHVCHRFLPGHRLRLALSTAYWPMVWPAPDNPALTLEPEFATLTLPTSADVQEVEMASPVAPPAANIQLHQLPKNDRRVIHDQGEQRTMVEILDDYGEIEYVDNGMINQGIKRERFEINWNDHLSAEHHLHWTQMLRRGEWQVSTETKGLLTCDHEYFYLDVTISAFEHGEPVWEKRWEKKVSRSLG